MMGYKGWLHLETLEEKVTQSLSTKLDRMDSWCQANSIQAKQKVSWRRVKENSCVCQAEQ